MAKKQKWVLTLKVGNLVRPVRQPKNINEGEDEIEFGTLGVVIEILGNKVLVGWPDGRELIFEKLDLEDMG